MASKTSSLSRAISHPRAIAAMPYVKPLRHMVPSAAIVRNSAAGNGDCSSRSVHRTYRASMPVDRSSGVQPSRSLGGACGISRATPFRRSAIRPPAAPTPKTPGE